MVVRPVLYLGLVCRRFATKVGRPIGGHFVGRRLAACRVEPLDRVLKRDTPHGNGSEHVHVASIRLEDAGKQLDS